MKITHTKTRWYFSTFVNHYELSACVEFSRTANGKKQVNVFDYTGRTLLWSSTGVQRMDQKAAKLAFTIYAEQEAKKTAKPMKLAFAD